MNVKSSHVGHIAVKLIELAKRAIDFDKKIKVYKNGEQNDYPERVERVINNSPTAKAATKLFRKYTQGQGIPSMEEVVVNKKGQTFPQFHKLLCASYTTHNGAFVHVGYNLDLEVATLEMLPFGYCRIGEIDDNDWAGKIVVCEDWQKAKASDVEKYDTFNPLKEVVKAQIMHAGKIKDWDNATAAEKAKALARYKGQIAFLNPEDSVYPLAHIDPAMNDADSEYQSGVYKNTILRKGFFGKTMLVTPPMMGEFTTLMPSEINSLSEQERLRYNHLKSEQKAFEAMIQKTLGAENQDGVLHIQMRPGEDRKIEDVIMFKNIDAQIDDKKFEYTEKSVADKIRKAINCIPAILIDRSDSALFGNSGEMLYEAQIAFQSQCEEDRAIIEDFLKRIFKFSKSWKEIEVKTKLLIEPKQAA